MEIEPCLHYTRLWESGSRSWGSTSSSFQAGETRKTAGVRKSFIKAALADAHSNNSTENRKSCAVQSARSNYRRAPSSAGLTRHPTPSSIPPRSHSSLGFSGKNETLRGTLLHPRGFDLQGYIKKHGSANDIRIGINGQCSSDEYFERYLDECAVEAQCEKSISFNDMEEVDLTERSTSPSQVMAAPHTQLPVVPLCWEDQLKKAEPDNILPKNKCRTPIISWKKSSISPSSGKVLSSKHLQGVSVSIKHCNDFLLPPTKLQQLKLPQPLATVSQLRSETAGSLPKQKVCVIPRADLAEEEDEGKGEEGAWTGEEKRRGEEGNRRGEEEEGDGGARINTPSRGGGYMDWGISDLEADGFSLPLDVNITNGRRKHATDPPEILPVDIHFHCNDPDTLTVLSGCTFEVAVSPIGTESAPKPLAKPRVVSDTECVLSVAAKVKLSSELARLTVTCCAPRMQIFSTVLDMDPPSQKNSPGEDGRPVRTGGEDSSMDPRRGDSGEQVRDPQCRQDSECHRQDRELVDEDITDLDVVAELFPDLHMVELMNRDSPTATSPPPPAFSSPVHGAHLHNLNTVAARERGKPLIPDGRYLIAMTNQAENEEVFTAFRSSKGKKSTKPVQQKAKPCPVLPSYTAIAEQRLKTYSIR